MGSRGFGPEASERQRQYEVDGSKQLKASQVNGLRTYDSSGVSSNEDYHNPDTSWLLGIEWIMNIIYGTVLAIK